MNERVVAGSVLVVSGMFVAALFSFGVVANYEELGAHSCYPQPYPVCGSIVWLMVEWGRLALIGIAMVVAGLYMASSPTKIATPASSRITSLVVGEENRVVAPEAGGTGRRPPFHRFNVGKHLLPIHRILVGLALDFTKSVLLIWHLLPFGCICIACKQGRQMGFYVASGGLR